MDKKVVYRKLTIGEEDYYQLCDVVDINEDLGEIKSYEEVGEGADIFYRVRSFVNDEDIKRHMYLIYKYEGEGKERKFTNLTDIYELHVVKNLFHEYFDDFSLEPKNSINVDKVYKAILKEVKYHDLEIKQLLNVLKSNLDILESDIDEESKKKFKTNILLYGPSGYGKSLIMETMARNIEEPIIGIRLSNNLETNIKAIAEGLFTYTLGDVSLAEHGIVLIEDNFDEFENEEEANKALEEVLTYGATAFNNVPFDFNKLTFIVEKKTDDESIDSLFGSIDEMPISQRVYDNLSTKICVGFLDEKEKEDILLNNPKCPINIYRKILGKHGRELVLEDGVIPYLIEKCKNTTGGIKFLYECLDTLIKARWTDDIVVLTKNIIDEEIDIDSEMNGDFSFEEELPKGKKYTKTKKNEDESQTNTKEFVLNRDEIRKKSLEMYKKLQRDVKGQDEPLLELVTTMVINNIYQNSNLSMEQKRNRIQHILLRGKPGTGKTFMTRKTAELFPDRVFFIADATEYTKAGYVGKSVDDMLIALINIADGDVKKAQKGILFIDEIDKIAQHSGEQSDVSNGAVQEALLKLVEGNIYNLTVGSGPIAKNIQFDTSELIIIGGGAFEGLSEIVKNRVDDTERKNRGLGFGNPHAEKKEVEQKCTTSDLQHFGMHKQLLRRLKMQIVLNDLTKEDYRDIMLNSDSSFFLLQIEELKYLGISVSYDDAFVDAFITAALKLDYGVSSIDILANKLFSYIKSKFILEDFNEVVLTSECVKDPHEIAFKKSEVKAKKREK